jgi:molecular chaperone HtpG
VCSSDLNIFGGENLNETDTQIKDMFENILIGEKKENSDWTIEVKKVASSVAPAYLKIDQSSKRFQQMAKQMGNMGFNMPLKKTLVLNPASPLIQNAFKLWGKDDKKEIAQKICRHVQDLASFSSEGLEEKEKHQFIERAQSLMTELSSMAL